MSKAINSLNLNESEEDYQKNSYPNESRIEYKQRKQIAQLEAELATYKSGNVPVTELISANEGMAVDIKQLQAENDKLKGLIGSSCFHPSEHPLYDEWFEKCGNDETNLNFSEWLINEVLETK